MKEKFVGICILAGSLLISTSIWLKPNGESSIQTDYKTRTEVSIDGELEEIFHEYYYFNHEQWLYRYDTVQETLEMWNPNYRLWIWMDNTEKEIEDRINESKKYDLYSEPRTVDMLQGQ